MKNPYDPPLSEQKDSPAQAGLLPLIFGVIFAVLCALIPMLFTPSFKSIFDSFGAELPTATQLLLDDHPLLWGLPILVIGAYFLWPKKKKLPLWLGIFSLAVTIPFVIWALYSPIFHLDSVV
jgi:type II secretory pathway component PulF